MKLLSNPVLNKELRGRMRGNRAMIILTIYLAVVSLVTLLIYLAFDTSFRGSTSLEDGRNIGKAIFLTVVTVALIGVCIITPSLTAGSIAGEKERQSYDVLITTLLSGWQIVLGKLFAAIAFAALLIAAILPLAGLSFLFGGVSGTELTIAVVGLIVTVVLYASVGLFWSTVMRTTLGATVMAQATIILSLLGIPFLFVMLFTLLENVRVLDELVESSLFIYAVGMVLCIHPFIALGITEASLINNENLFFFTIDTGNDILVPSPWLAYLFLASLLTALLLVLSVRLLRPVDYGLSRQRRN
jgi:ABC-type transport system involved in multi-copper enzyme maturation permease subunit